MFRSASKSWKRAFINIVGMVEEKDCDLAPTLKPLNGTVSCTNGKKTNSKCTITCDEGFTIRY